MSKDIKKALEHCAEWKCDNCPNRDDLGSGEIVCRGRLLPQVLEYVADLEAKLAESEKQCRDCKHLNKKIELNIKNKLMAENCELQKQLAEKEKYNLILYSMLYETLEKQSCENVASQIDQMTGFTLDKQAEWFKGNRNCDELLKLLAEKEKEIEEMQKQLSYCESLLVRECKECDNKFKTDFAIKQLEKVKEWLELKYFNNEQIEYLTKIIDQQIKELKEKK